MAKETGLKIDGIMMARPDNGRASFFDFPRLNWHIFRHIRQRRKSMCEWGTWKKVKGWLFGDDAKWIPVGCIFFASLLIIIGIWNH
jgi:hypothetical protein